MNHSRHSPISSDLPISLGEALELRTLFFTEEGENLHYVPTRGQHHLLTDLQETVQRNMNRYL